MFDEARNQLIDALNANNAALTLDEAKEAVHGNTMLAEAAINEHAVIEQADGTDYIVSVAGTDQRFTIPDDGDDEPAQAPEEAAEETEAEEDPEDTDTQEPAQQATQTDWDASDDDATVYNVNGLRITTNPDEALAGTPTGDDIHGARKLTNSHPDVPSTDVPYYPANLGERDTEDLFYRSLGLSLPIILEGEAGTGKNQLVKAAGASLNLPTYRQEFGSDTSVFDVVGEKDFDDDGSYYILGKAAKAAMFGGVYVADEINMATGSVTSYLHPLFEKRGDRELELRGTGVTLRDLPENVEFDPEKHLGKYIHPDFHAVGTCNPLHYADTSEMNDALRSRCVVIEHPYLCEAEDEVRDSSGSLNPEAHLLADETGCDPSDVEDLLRAVAVLREARREGNALSCPIGHRELRDTVRLAGPNEEFMSFKEAAQIKIAGQASLKQDKQYIGDTLEDEL